MLTHIGITGLAIVDQAGIELDSGLNIITGETGAGKSILVKALGLLAGQKADPSVVSSHHSQASVTAEFELSEHASVIESLKEIGIDFELSSSASVLIRRIVQKNGRSKAFINDQAVTLSSLKNIASQLLDVFSQHESHAMLAPKNHVDYLDKFLKQPSLSSKYQTAYQSVLACLKKHRSLSEQLRKVRSEEDYIQFRFSEFEKLAPTHADFDELQHTLSDLERKQSTQELRLRIGSEVLSLNRFESSLSNIAQFSQDLKNKSEEWGSLSEAAERALEAFNDLSYTAARLEGDSDDQIANELESVQARLSIYRELMRKTSADSITELLERQSELANSLDSIRKLSEEQLELEKSMSAQINSAYKLGKQLSGARKDAAERVSTNLEVELKSLVMPKAKVNVAFEKLDRSVFIDRSEFQNDSEEFVSAVERLSKMSIHGLETAQFMLSANPGEQMRPLQKVVSGGELSRIMLALKKALSAGAGTCVLVFDEIDSGISGQVADVVGKKLNELAQKFQILCISHLPQVAVYADNHILVAKKQSKSQTKTTFRNLELSEREKEVARLISGPEITSSSMSHARALYKKAKSKNI